MERHGGSRAQGSERTTSTAEKASGSAVEARAARRRRRRAEATFARCVLHARAEATSAKGLHDTREKMQL